MSVPVNVLFVLCLFGLLCPSQYRTDLWCGLGVNESGGRGENVCLRTGRHSGDLVQ